MHRIWILGVVATAGCTSSYEVDGYGKGPVLRLTQQDPDADFSIRVCLEPPPSNPMESTVVDIALLASATAPADLWLTVDEADGDLKSEQAMIAAGKTAALESHTEFSLGEVTPEIICDDGMFLALERLDADLEGTVEIEWTVDAQVTVTDRGDADAAFVRVSFD